MSVQATDPNIDHPAPPQPVAHHFADYQQQREAAKLGIWTFLLTEVMLFGALFLAYTVYRWSYPEAFAAASRHLDLPLGAINTVILISSSLSVALAHQAAEQQKQKLFTIFLVITLALGGVFLGIKSVEYAHKFSEHHVPGPSFQWKEKVASPTEAKAIELFFLLYFILTGLHAVHVVLGLSFLAGILADGLYHKRPSPVLAEVGGLYWHFVDVVWIYVFPLLYLIGLD